MKWILKKVKAYRCGYRRRQASRRRDYLPYRQWQEGCSIIEGDREDFEEMKMYGKERNRIRVLAGNEEHLQVPGEGHRITCHWHPVCSEVSVWFQGAEESQGNGRVGMKHQEVQIIHSIPIKNGNPSRGIGMQYMYKLSNNNKFVIRRVE